MKLHVPLLLMGVALLVCATVEASESELEELEGERSCIAKWKLCGWRVTKLPCCKGTTCLCYHVAVFTHECKCQVPFK
uniref:U9-Deinotoxin-Dsu1b_1 n=1 Tax=Deinopis subrufa TaxID=1905329 RepID=A0A4Q8KDQ3_DEISU